MKKTKIIACEMLRPEVESILADTNLDYEVIMIEKYGEDTAKMLTETMYGGYKRVALIDTGIGNYDELLAYEKPLKDIFGFNKYPVKGTAAYLQNYSVVRGLMVISPSSLQIVNFKKEKEY